MATLSNEDLTGASYGGVVPPDVMDKIFNIQKIPLPLTDMIGKETATAERKEWLKDTQGAIDAANAVVDGATSAKNNEAVGTRVSNFCQISTKEVNVSDRADNVNSYGGMGKLAYQVMMRQNDLRRDVEAMLMLNNASVAGVADTTASEAGGLAAWLETNVSFGAGGSAGGFNTSTGVVDAATRSTNRRALSEATLKTVGEDIYTAGNGMPTKLLTHSSIAKRISTYYLSATTIAALRADQGRTTDAAVALGAVGVVVLDFGMVLDVVPNRLMQSHNDGSAAACYDVFLIDPNYLALAYLQGYQVTPLAKTGLNNRRMMSVDWTLVVKNEAALGLVSDIQDTAMTA